MLKNSEIILFFSYKKIYVKKIYIEKKYPSPAAAAAAAPSAAAAVAATSPSTSNFLGGVSFSYTYPGHTHHYNVDQSV